MLTDVYAALEFDWTATTAGAVDEEVPGVTVDDVERAVIASFDELEPATLDERNPRPRAPARTTPPNLKRG